MAIRALKKLDIQDLANNSELDSPSNYSPTDSKNQTPSLKKTNFELHSAEQLSTAVTEQKQNSLSGTHPKISISNFAKQRIQEDLARLARFGANISDAHSCFIFLSTQLLNDNTQENSPASLPPQLMVAHHTLSVNINPEMQLHSQTGFLGWALRNDRALHISPFERDSRSIEIYKKDEKLKSLLAIPFSIGHENNQPFKGMLVCDSKKSFSFSKLQQKLLTDLTLEISNITSLHINNDNKKENHLPTWDQFYSESLRLLDQIGLKSLKLVRVTFSDYNHLKSNGSLSSFVERASNLQKLIKQAVPKAFPSMALPNGDMLFLVDSMFNDILLSRVSAIIEDEKNKNDLTQKPEVIDTNSPDKIQFFSKKVKQGLFSKKNFSQLLEDSWTAVQTLKNREMEFII